MKNILFATASLMLIAALSTVSLACACCADHGYRFVGGEAVDTSRLELLKEMDLGPQAVLYTSEAGFEGIRGLNAIEGEYNSGGLDGLDLVDVFTGKIWKLTLKTPGGKTGTLTLTRPARMTVLRVDQHEVEVGAGEAVLYKEFRFDGRVGTGSGFLKSSAAAKYSLIFQGKGNMCDSSSDFSHWYLDVKGPAADYAFFGKMKA